MIYMIAEDGIDVLNAWLARAGLRGESEAALVSGFCERPLPPACRSAVRWC
jgi:hypothetical protein